MKTILFSSQNFGFGPTTKMLAIADQINDTKKIFFGTGVAFDLAKIHQFDEVYELSHSNEPEIMGLFGRSDLFINVMDFPLGKFADRAGCSYFLVDSLLWFYPQKPNLIEYADKYFCQNFFESVDKKIEEYHLTNASVIGPITSNNFERYEKIDQAIVNFGGCDGRIGNSFVEVGVNNQYPLIILRVMLPILQKYFSQVLIVGRERVMEICKNFFELGGKVKFRMLDQKTMLEELFRSKVLFTVPGIQTFYDAAGKIPIFFLPGSNHSHSRNMHIFIQNQIAKYYFCWQEAYGLSFKGVIGRQERIDLVLSMVNHFSKDDEKKSLFRNKVKHFIADGQWSSLVGQQKNALQKLGGDGRQAIVDAVNACIHPCAEKLSLNV